MNKKAAFLQRCYRGMRGRVKTTEYRGRLENGVVKMDRVIELHKENKLWESIFDKDGDGEEDEMPPEDELLDAALSLLCVHQDYENARLYVRDALRFYPESPRALIIYAILLHIVWDAYGFLKVPRPDVLDEALEIVEKAWELDPERTSFKEFEVEYFENARRIRPYDPRRLTNQAVMLHVVYRSFDSSKEKLPQLKMLWESNRRAENLFARAIVLDESCKFPQIRSITKVFRTLYRTKREVCIDKPKSFPIGKKGGKVMFNLTIYKALDKSSSELDRREKLICHAAEKPIKFKGGAAPVEITQLPSTSTSTKTDKIFKNAVNSTALASVLSKSAIQLEKAFDVSSKRKVKKAENEKQVSERSERALRKTRNIYEPPLNHQPTQFVFRTFFARCSKPRLRSKFTRLTCGS